MTLIIDVLQADIDAALQATITSERDLQYCCPVAQAVKRMFPTQNVSIGRFRVGIGTSFYHALDHNGDIMGTITALDRNSWPQARPVSFVVTQEYIP